MTTVTPIHEQRQMQLAIQEIQLLRSNLHNEMKKVQFLKAALSLLKQPEGSIEARHFNNIIENTLSTLEERQT